MRGLRAQHIQRSFLFAVVSHIDPQKKPAARELFIDELRVVRMEHPAERGSERGARAGGDENRYQGSRSGNDKCADTGQGGSRQIVGLKPGYARKERRPRRLRVVLDLLHLRIAVTQLLRYRGFARENR